ncbi:MAG: beta-lactamase family protein, partial [Comamonadaceae bacterium]|nr:beta-lactamase family protein [Comamonadaceae bacterium]
MKKLVAIHLALGFALGPAVEASASETPDQHVAQQRAALPPAAMQAAQAMLAQRSGGFSVGTGVRGQAASLTRFGDIQADTQYPIASASKFLAAATVMAVVDEGKLQLDAPIATWLPTLPPAAGKLTLRQLLSQTSGLAGVKGEYYDLAQDHRITLEQSAMDVTQRPLISVPGEVFAYGSAGFQLAGAAVEAATGQRWAQVFQDKIATPLGMTRTYWTHLRLDSADELPLTDEQGGPRRLLAVLGDAWADSARRGQAVVALMDQGPYLVQRQAIHTAPATAQWLATPRGDSTGVTLDLPDEPEGMTYDLASGQVRPGGRGVRIYALSVHADIPRRPGRHGLDAIEQHAMLRASSLRMEWPRQAGDVLEVTGGKLLVWASDATQRFPSGFGTDGRLFTPDDPMVALPRGYTLVTLDPQGFR